MKPLLFAAFAISLATSAAAQEAQVWAVETPKEGDATLAFGTPNLADAPIFLRCPAKSGQVEVTASLTRTPPPALTSMPASVTVTSDAASATLRGQVTRATGTGSLAVAEFSTRAPVTAAFRKTGVVSVTALGETITPPPAPKSMVRKFLGACR